jgi:ABC-2 type transport system ATP-binding protein
VEELCERMCMFNKGQLVLYGAVADVRRRYAPNAVIVQGTGDFAHLPGVERVEQVNGAVELWLDGTTGPQDILRTLANRPDVEIERFEVATPSLDDVFIAVVEGQDRVTHRSAPRSLEALEV